MIPFFFNCSTKLNIHGLLYVLLLRPNCAGKLNIFLSSLYYPNIKVIFDTSISLSSSFCNLNVLNYIHILYYQKHNY